MNQDTPQADDDQNRWAELVEGIDPAWILAAIEADMSPVLRRRESPEDILQQALDHAWRDRKKHQWNGPKAFRGWVRQIAHNRVLDRNKYWNAKRRLPDALALPPSSAPDAPTDSKSPSRIAMRRERMSLLRLALAELPSEQRELLLLRDAEDLTWDAIARHLRIPGATARYRHRQAAEALKARLRALGTTSSTE